ncbi:hypothetical protein Dimus_023009 [Dionaea muscipula]
MQAYKMQRNNGIQGTHQALRGVQASKEEVHGEVHTGSLLCCRQNRESSKRVHKVFGVGNVRKIIKSLSEEDRKRAADSLVWEAFCRRKDPVLRVLMRVHEFDFAEAYNHCLRQPDDEGAQARVASLRRKEFGWREAERSFFARRAKQPKLALFHK